MNLAAILPLSSPGIADRITQAVQQSIAPAFILAAIATSLNALMTRMTRVFEQMRELVAIRGDQRLLGSAMTLLQHRYLNLGMAMRLALGSAVVAMFVGDRDLPGCHPAV